MGMPGGWELVLIVVVILLLFGGKKIPELAKGLGRGIKDFKKAMSEDEKENTKVAEAKDTKEIEAKKEQSSTQTKEIKEA